MEFFLGLKSFREEKSREWIKGCQDKMLVIGGREDKFVKPKDIKQLIELAPRVKLEIIQDAGHLVPYERFDRFNSLVEAFISH
jgi:Predicted hydrolases or acyltransferases (alpha/beta hydrolase superfamily)